MTKISLFIWISVVLVVIAGIISFKSFKQLRKTLYWVIFPDSISMWFRKLWKKDLGNTFHFEVFLLSSFILVGINYLIFRYLV